MNTLLYLHKDCLNKVAVESLVQFFHDKGIGLSSRLSGDLLIITARPYEGTEDDQTLSEITDDMLRRVDGISDALRTIQEINRDD